MLIAGVTVVVSLLGLFFMGVSYLRGVALSAGLAVVVVMAAAVTLLPALLAFAGERVNRLRIPGLAWTLRPPGPDAPAARWSHFVPRRPWPAAIVATAILLALAAPVLGLRLGFPDAGNDQRDTTTRQAYDLIERGFGPGANGPLLVAIDLRRDATQELPRLARRLRAEPGVAFVVPPRLNQSGNAALVAVVPASSPESPDTEDLVHRLRDQVVPEALAGSGATAHLGGVTPSFAAGAIMVVVFLAFLLSTEIFLKLLGLGMATAIFVDATIVRMVLVPAIMQLLGRAKWWVPGWLDRVLPRLDVAVPATFPAASRSERRAA